MMINIFSLIICWSIAIYILIKGINSGHLDIVISYALIAFAAGAINLFLIKF